MSSTAWDTGPAGQGPDRCLVPIGGRGDLESPLSDSLISLGCLGFWLQMGSWSRDVMGSRYHGVMAQSGWRLPDDLLRRVRVRCAELGVRQNVFVERALESALGKMEDQPPRPCEGSDRLPVDAGGGSSAAPSRASVSRKTQPAAVEAVIRPGSPHSVPVPGVRPAREFVLDPRQAALNKAKKA